ncbi:hypothetical protein FHS08_001954 [Microbacterium ulmi]|nr:hypothetical protein [Microbacterium ulmi]
MSLGPSVMRSGRGAIPSLAHVAEEEYAGANFDGGSE